MHAVVHAAKVRHYTAWLHCMAIL